MDIAIDPHTLRSRLLHAWARWFLAALCVVGFFILIREWITPNIARREIRTAVVERGAISTEVRAAGTVVPKTERVLTSPVSSSIDEIYVPLGSQVKKGDAILKLDSSRIELEIRRLEDELLLKDLEIEGLLQQQAQQLRELRNQEELARIDLQSLQVILERYKTLYQENIVSEFDYEAARLDVRKTEIQLQQLAQQISDTLQTDHNQNEQRRIEKQILFQQLAEQQRILADTTMRASADGIITVLMSELGQNVLAGSELARISDLSSYRIDATLSDFYLHQISVDMPVNIDSGNGNASGRLNRILPAVDNGAISLQIELDNPHDGRLKPNMRVEAGILTRQRDSGIRVTNGIVFNGPGLQDVFVIEGSQAVKRTVEVGLQNSNFVEIISGLAEGEEIIISDMRDYQHLEQVALKD